tara:strand:- start:645 stop:824 length:180 start_codon:yes stop_codon:yes gene_type:complete
MTKKDYEVIAKVIKNSELSETKRLQIALEMSNELLETNNNFEENVFLKACIPNIDEYNL